MLDALNQFLDETRDTREYKRALAVKMAHEGIAYDVIAATLQVSKPFISKWKRIYAEVGIAGLRMGYHGAIGYLTSEQRDQTIAWLREQNAWSVSALQASSLSVGHVSGGLSVLAKLLRPPACGGSEVEEDPDHQSQKLG